MRVEAHLKTKEDFATIALQVMLKKVLLKLWEGVLKSEGKWEQKTLGIL